jgi:hypothetical protein
LHQKHKAGNIVKCRGEKKPLSSGRESVKYRRIQAVSTAGAPQISFFSGKMAYFKV